MIQRSPKHNLWPPLRTLSWDLTAVRHMSMSTPPQFDWHSVLFVFSFSGSTCARLSDSSECDAAAISAEEQQALWQKVPTTLPGGPQMSRQVGQVLLFNRGVKGWASSPERPARGIIENIGRFLFCVFICSVYPSVSPVALLHLFIVSLGH